MKLLENIFIQNVGLLQGKLVYIYSGKHNCKLLYQDLIDSNIFYFYDTKLLDVNKIPSNDMVRITSRNKEFARFDKQIVHRRFAPTFKKPEHKFKTNGVFAYIHSGFVVINYNYLLRTKKVERLLELSKK